MSGLLRNSSIAVKVALAPAFAVLCLVLVGCIGLLANHRMGQSLVQLGESQVPRIVSAGTLAQKLAAMHARVNQSLAWEGAGFKAEKIEALDKSILAQLKAYDAELAAAAEGRGVSDQDRQRLAQARAEFGKYSQNAKAALDIKTGMLGNAASYMTTLDSSFANLNAALNELVAQQVQSATTAVADARRLTTQNQAAIGTGIGVALLASLLLSVLVSRLIVRPLEQASQVANAVADGDLSMRVSDNGSTDATGRVLRALGSVSRNLSVIVNSIRATAQEVNRASSEIASGNMDLSTRTEHTASALQQTAASIEELSATIHNSADNAKQADVLARDASDVARQGGVVVGDVIETMDAINAQAKKIGEIIAVIDGIAFQTNILALNAAVEAARAGEQGRGFSVVASEVRTLAQRSADAAKEIRTLIVSSVERIDTGVAKVQVAGETMSRIVKAIEQVSGTVGEISSAAGQQADGIAQLSQAVSEMDRNTQQNAAMVEQASAAALSLKGQSDSLVQLLAQFRTAD